MEIEPDAFTSVAEDQERRAFHSRPTMMGGGIGIAGAHRCGKTTLAQMMHRGNPNIPFVQTSTKEIAARFGFDVNAKHNFETRLTFQEYVLLHHQALFEQQTGLFLTDRTPLDFAAYLLADVSNGEVDDFTQARVKNYLERCAELANKHFMNFLVLQPGIPFVPTPGSPAPNLCYQEQINALVIGFGRSYVTRPFYLFDRDVTDLNGRADLSAQIISKELGNYQSALTWLPRN